MQTSLQVSSHMQVTHLDAQNCPISFPLPGRGNPIDEILRLPLCVALLEKKVLTFSDEQVGCMLCMQTRTLITSTTACTTEGRV